MSALLLLRRFSIVSWTVLSVFRSCARDGRWVLIPMFAVLLLTMALLSALALVEYVAPFVYTVF